jgi:predicted aldo/keto reductase-like oxidoreductase
MQYRTFGSLDWKISALGFGAMRLPTLSSREIVDEPEAIRMLRYAIDHGVNYVDTAYPYHGGHSELVVGRALRDGYRERVHLATKLPVPRVESPDDFDRFLDEQLEKLGTSYVDVYLFHGLRRPRWETVLKHGLLARADRALADGRIRHLGFSFHDSLATFKEIIASYDNWTMCQIQYNYMSEDLQAGTAGLEYAADKGLAIVVMEPLLGGRLVTAPAEVHAAWDAAQVHRTPAEWALSWLWSKPEVSVVLSGMSTMQQVEDNVAYASRSSVGMFTTQDLEAVARARDAYNRLCPVPCTGCRYCMPCPNGVAIPEVFTVFNSGVMFSNMDHPRGNYASMPEEQRASSCVQCRTCEALCPQSIPISQWMPIVHQILGEGQNYDPSVCPVLPS